MSSGSGNVAYYKKLVFKVRTVGSQFHSFPSINPNGQLYELKVLSFSCLTSKTPKNIKKPFGINSVKCVSCNYKKIK